MQHVQHHLDLGDHFVPKLERTGWVDGGECRDHVVLDCFDSGLGGIDAMIVRLDELNVDLLFFVEILYHTRTVDVHDM